jgi:hypothetical protein
MSKQLKEFLTSKKAKVAAGLTAVAGSSLTAQAADYTTQITQASTDGTANVTATIGAVIAIAILGFGVGRMLGWFGR